MASAVAPATVVRTVVPATPAVSKTPVVSESTLAQGALRLLPRDQRAALLAVVGRRFADDHQMDPEKVDPNAFRLHNLEKILFPDEELLFAADDEDGEGLVEDFAAAETREILTAPAPVPLPVAATKSPRIPFQCSSGDLAKFCKNPLITWLDHYLQYHPEAKDKLVATEDRDDPNAKHWMTEGLRHEAEYLRALKEGRFREHFPHMREDQQISIVEIAKMENEDWSNPAAHELRYQATLQAMREGQDVIYQAYVRSTDGVFYGFADFLVKVPNPPGGKSIFGNYHYEPWDTKLAKKEKIEYMIQLCCYVDMLADMQGCKPKKFVIVNGDSQKIEFQTGQYFATYKEIRDMFIAFILQLEKEIRDQPNPPIDVAGFSEDPELELEEDLERMPVIPKAQGYGRYTTFILDLLRRRDALTYVAGINNRQIIKLSKLGIKTMTDLAELEHESNDEGNVWFYRRNIKNNQRERLPIDIDDVTLRRLIDQADIQVCTLGRLRDLPEIAPEEMVVLRAGGINYIKDLSQATKPPDGIAAWRFAELGNTAKIFIETHGLTKPLYEIIPIGPDSPHSGLALLPPENKHDVYTDFEWLPGRDGWTYLFMAVYDDSRTGETRRKAFWAYSKDEEKKAFEEYIDWLYARFKAEDKMHAYHFTAAEPTVIRRLSEKYGTRLSEVGQMFRSHSFVDTFAIMKQAMRIGSYSYGMKKIEPIFMGPRQAPVKSATESIIWFQNWLDNPDGRTVADSQTLRANEDYCGEDCLGQRGHTKWLRDEQEKQDITYNPAKAPKGATPSDYEREMDKLKQGLRDEGLHWSRLKGDPEFDRIYRLFSALPDYHDREASLVFRAKFERAAMTKEELVTDLATLGALILVEGSESARPSRRRTYLGVDAFAQSQKVYANQGKNDVAEIGVVPREVPQDRDAVLTALELDRSQKPKVHRRSSEKVYTFKGTPSSVEDIKVGDRLYFETRTFLNQNGTWGKIESANTDTGEVRIRFNAKTLMQLDGRVPLKIGITANRTTTRQYTYTFDPAQMTKLGVKDKCVLANDLTVHCLIAAIDYKQGRVTVEFGPSALARMGGDGPPREIALIPDEYVSAKAIQDAIVRQLKGLTRDKDGNIIPLPEATRKLLRRLNPKIAGQAGVSIIPPDLTDEETTQAITKAVENLKGSTLVIQGPPGTGKSYQGTKAIVNLIKKARAEGRKIKIGITANSHLSGLNLAEMVSKELLREGMDPLIAKVGDGYGSIDTENLPEGIVFRRDVGALFSKPRSKSQIKLAYEDLEIVVGTAWTFCNEDLAGDFDYLFVDDASQVGLANLFGMGQSLKRPDVEKGTEEHGNIVLLGDHRQLDQPSRASHPDGADKSAIEYYLDGKNVIPPERGIFLKKTWRNHSTIAHSYSEQIYEGRVESHPDNDEQRINLPRHRGKRKRPKYVTKEAGFIYVPVKHNDNIHKSDEEVSIIGEIVDELYTRTFTDRNGNTRKITRDDIMIVAPYNLQTKHLALALGDRAQVGTIDKFQGREAPVVIVSMSASQIHPSSPLMRFEFDERRLNVAISRAQAMVIVVASGDLKKIRPRSPVQMRQLNFYHLATDSQNAVDPTGREHLRQDRAPL